MQIVSDYYVMACLMAILLILLLWKTWRFKKLYIEFPKPSIMDYKRLFYEIFKNPNDLPFTTPMFAFVQKHLKNIVFTSKSFQKEGMFLTWLPGPHLFIYGEEAVKIFSNEQAAINKTSMYEVIMEVLGSGLGLSNDETWRAHRKMLNPVFHVGVLKNKLPIFYNNAKILVRKIKEKTMKDTPIDVLEFLKPCTFGIICEYIFGLKMNIPENKEKIEFFSELVENLSEMLMFRLFQPWLRFTLLQRCLPSGRKYTELLSASHSFALEIISEMRKNILLQEADRKSEEDDLSDDRGSRKSFAHILLDHHLKDNSFTMEDVKSEVITFIAAGYDTITHALEWILFMLGHHPDIQDKVYHEVDSILEENIKFEDLYKLKYLECVIKETLRLYPIVPLYARTLNKDIQCGKYNVPKGTDIVFFPYMLHRNPDVYPDPENFNPDRFLEDRLNKMSWNYIPFSEGIRNCIGKRFTLIEIKVILAYILRYFKVKSLDKMEDVVLSWKIVLVPTKPLQFQFTSRKGMRTGLL